MGGSDWYVTEYSPEEKVCFGFAILNGDIQNAEWGYISLQELEDVKIGFIEVDRDLHWKKCKAGEVQNIVRANGI